MNENIDTLIQYWEDKHFTVLSEYSKGSPINEVMQMYRGQMLMIRTIINQLNSLKK